MASKIALSVLGLLAMVALISSNAASRELAKTSSISITAEVVKENHDVRGVKNGEKADNVCSNGESTNCIGMIPGIPGIPGLPGLMPGMPGGPGKKGYSGRRS